MIKYFLYNVETKQGITKAVDSNLKLFDVCKKLEELGTKVEFGGIIFNKEGKVTGIDPEDAIPMEPEYRLEPKPKIFPDPEPPKKRVNFVKIVIKAPIWKEPRTVGIALEKITDNIQVEISYRRKDNRLLYPDPFFMSKQKALTYPQQAVKGKPKLKLVMIPLQDFETNARNIDRITEAPEF